jgi:hypothetical protein
MFLVSPKTLKMGRRNSAVTTEEKVVSCGNERKSHVHKNKRGLSDSGSTTHEEVREICRVGGVDRNFRVEPVIEIVTSEGCEKQVAVPS